MFSEPVLERWLDKRRHHSLAAVPYFDHDITDLAGLLQLGEQIWR